MYRKRDGVNVFNKNTYYGCGLLGKIKYFFHDIKHCYHRIRYGWCNRDTWDIFSWFLDVVPPMLQHLRDNHSGYPCSMDEEMWEKTLETMIHLFSEADEDRCSVKNEYDQYTDYEQWHTRELEIGEYRNKCKNKAFDMFRDYFWNLWD